MRQGNEHLTCARLTFVSIHEKTTESNDTCMCRLQLAVGLTLVILVASIPQLDSSFSCLNCFQLVLEVKYEFFNHFQLLCNHI